MTGQRLPVATDPDVDAAAVTAELLRGVRWSPTTSARRRCTSCSAPSPRSSTWPAAATCSPAVDAVSLAQPPRQDPAAPPFESFDDYLATFRSRNRKQVRKERQEAAAHGLGFRTAAGAELEPRDWQALRAFYLANVDRHHGTAYLTDEFFEVARETLAHRLVATIAYRGTEPVAGTINFEKGSHLYGRYWGCLDDFQMLHFELCYYQLIERAITRRYTLFEAGAQGEHKLKRGLTPAYTHSAHWLRHPGLAEAVGEYVRAEEAAVVEQARLYAEHSPFNASHAPSLT